MAKPSHFLDLSHHLSSEVSARKINPLKKIIRTTLENPHLISLANGDPHYSLYPIRRVDYEVASVTDEDPVSSWRSLGASAPTQVLSSSHDDKSSLLRSSLQYGHGAGSAPTLRTVTEINNLYHTAPNHVATMTLGNADGITKVFRILGGPGDHFLADEFTFGPMPLAAEAHGVKWVPVRIDSGGIIPEDLEKVLAGWDYRRGRIPHVLYMVPCGQNPTGSTLSLPRRKQIYAIAQKYDLIIVEDDPYYFLQYDSPHSGTPVTKKPFPQSLLSLDVDGRVIRIDSFSKIMAPGLRLGWITSTPTFRDHLIKYIDLSTQNPCGFPQILVTQLLGPHGWQLSGFDRWVRSLRLDYQRRRDFFLDLFEREVASTGWVSTDVPEAGMFVWIRVHIEQHPRFRENARVDGGPQANLESEKGPSCDSWTIDGTKRQREGEETDSEWAVVGSVPRTNAKALMYELFEACLAGGLVICPATVFILPSDSSYDEEGSVHIDDRSNYLRATFAGSEETMAAGVPILGRVLRDFFADASKST